jgi:hypothetical protein
MRGEKKRNEHEILIEKIKWKRPLGKYYAWTEREAYIKMYLQETGWKGVDYLTPYSSER